MVLPPGQCRQLGETTGERRRKTGKDEALRPCPSCYPCITRTLVSCSQFLDLDRDLFRLCFLSFGDVELQDAMLEDDFDFLCFNVHGQSKGAAHFAYIVLAPYIGFLLNLLFLLLGSNDG